MRRKNPLPLFIAGFVIVSVLIFLFVNISNRHANTPDQVIEDFYDYEKEGDFGSSWELFHSEMKKKFSKSSYIQTKHHVFIGHMDVDTFEVEIDKITDIKDFKYSNEGPTFTKGKKAEVWLHFDSQFGKITIGQTCYVVEEEGEWRVLWDYDY